MRRKYRWTATALLAVACWAGAITSCAPEGPKSAAVNAATSVERGEYLAMVAGCQDCHTPGGMYGVPDQNRKLAGSDLGWEGPWGVTYPRNITPDQGTGIGAWSEADIVAAIRTGKRPDGTAVLPPMPWPSFAHMTDEDAAAIAAYLKSVPPISHKVPDRVPPGGKPSGSILTFPAPPAWDAPKAP